MTPRAPENAVAASGRSIVAWLTALQVLAVVSAVASAGLAFVPGSAEAQLSNFGPALRWVTPLLSVAQAVVTFFVLGWAKGWLTSARGWATGGAFNADAVAREDATLGRWLVFFQWLPVALALIAGPLLWSALSGSLSAAELERSLPPGTALTPEALRAAVQLGFALALLTVVLPSVVINFAVLGWVRRWMNGVTDALLARISREPRLGEVADTLGRWFTFLQVLLGILIALLLLVPLLPGGGGDRLTLLLGFLQLALLFALLRWSKQFMAGVTRRAREGGAM